MPNYYQILGLPYNASASEVKRAYREKAKTCHPDISRSEEAKREFQLLNQAYSILSDAEKRRKYDLLLLYRSSVIQEHFRKKQQKRQQRRSRARRAGGQGKKMTSTSRGYRYYKPDPTPLFKFGIYVTGILFGLSLFLVTSLSLVYNGWPIVSAFLFVPAWIAAYQGWNGMAEHRRDAGRDFLQGWGRFLKILRNGKKEER